MTIYLRRLSHRHVVSIWAPRLRAPSASHHLQNPQSTHDPTYLSPSRPLTSYPFARNSSLPQHPGDLNPPQPSHPRTPKAVCSHPYAHHRKKYPTPYHNTTTTPTNIPASFKIATLFPCCAIRPRRLAEPLIELPIEEKTSDYK